MREYSLLSATEDRQCIPDAPVKAFFSIFFYVETVPVTEQQAAPWVKQASFFSSVSIFSPASILVTISLKVLQYSCLLQTAIFAWSENKRNQTLYLSFSFMPLSLSIIFSSIVAQYRQA